MAEEAKSYEVKFEVSKKELRSIKIAKAQAEQRDKKRYSVREYLERLIEKETECA